ncbi:MAG: flagellar type III secretion system protein FlhB [Paludibacterium sp.]|uniref:flagellar biosynthesis protein FlhB n=1 Tax=Paludibacterium sp. TaxID=1917523 RepID=UPI0025D906A0|nr:flagellar biosynthesis protein FlhB [Paludibacterium sp.]MBV8047543.1 flagellar type III secretion system protein FlhB [Paludibacterium sp.]MBV8649017.1 flagellar type III secretion system protein FlhB [Paludibacterium sp.]
MAEDSDLERTEAATGKRLEQARSQGNVPRSRELSTFALTMTGVAMLMTQGGKLSHYVMELARRTLTFDHAAAVSPDTMLERFKDAIFGSLWQLAPMLATLFLVALFVPMLVGGWNFTTQAIEPNFGKFKLLGGIKRMVSLNALTEAVKAILKSVLIGGVGTLVIWNQRQEIISLGQMPLESGIFKLLDMMIHDFFIIAGAMILLVAIDVPFQLWSYHKKLRMTKEEVKREYKEQEGSPEVKGKIRQMQREAARRRMMQAVPTANVIVTNPTHYAVALLYKEGMRAPQVVAKGSLLLAEKIIDLAHEHRVAIMRVPSFARALYFNTEPGDEIPARLYAAAAQVLAYVHQLKLYEINGGLAPVYPDQIEVPADLDPQSKRQHDAAPGASE